MATNDKKATGEKRIIADIIPRIICLFIALVLWLYVVFNSTPDFEKSFEGVSVIPVNALVLEERDLTVYGNIENTVEVVIYGSRGNISTYSGEDIRATVDLIGIEEAGEHILPVKLELPDGAAVRSYFPKTISVTVQAVSENIVPVVVKPKYNTNYTVGTPVPSVANVTVTGPESELALIHHVEARPTYDDMLDATVTAVGVPLVACTADGTEIKSAYIGVEPSTVDVVIPIYDEKDVDIVVKTDNKALEAHTVASVLPSKLKLRCKIDRSDDVLDDITEVVVAKYDETHLSKNIDVTEIELPIVLDEKYENVSDIETVTVILEHRVPSMYAEKSVAISKANFAIDNPNNEEFEILTESLSVTVCMPGAAVKDLANPTLKGRDYHLVGSLADAKDGKLKVRLDVSDRNEYADEIYAVGEYFIEVNVK